MFGPCTASKAHDETGHNQCPKYLLKILITIDLKTLLRRKFAQFEGDSMVWFIVNGIRARLVYFCRTFYFIWLNSENGSWNHIYQICKPANSSNTCHYILIPFYFHWLCVCLSVCDVRACMRHWWLGFARDMVRVLILQSLYAATVVKCGRWCTASRWLSRLESGIFRAKDAQIMCLFICVLRVIKARFAYNTQVIHTSINIQHAKFIV